MTKPLGLLTEAIINVLGKDSVTVAGTVDVLHDTALLQHIEDNNNNNCRFYDCSKTNYIIKGNNMLQLYY